MKTDRLIIYHCNDETKLLSCFLKWWQENTPDVITGWNVQLFDIPYICNRMNRILGDVAYKTSFSMEINFQS